MTTSTETRIPTQTFLLPGQQFCIGLPWEREALKRPPLVTPRAPRPKKPVGSSTLDAVAELPADPRAGWEIGACEVIRRLTVDSDKSLLALRDDEHDGTALVVLRQLALPRSMAKEVARHAEWAARLHHPALARTFSNEETDEGYWWVTELVAGATFAELAVACRAEGKHVPTGLAVGAVLEAAQGLSEVHAAGSSHALVCDQSVAVAFDGTARLLDAGLFKCLAQQTSWSEVRSAMTPYFAPEQVLDGHAPDVRTDVYSLGVVLYEALSGEQALRGRSFEEVSRLHRGAGLPSVGRLNVALDRKLAAVVDRAVGPRAARFASARELATALREASGGCAWRKELRARFVSDLFSDRKRRQQVLLASLAPERAARRRSSLTVPAVPAPAPEPVSAAPATVATVPAPAPVAPSPVVTFPDRSTKRRSAPRSVSRVVLGVASVVGLAVGFAGSQVVRLAGEVRPATVAAAPVAPRIVVLPPIELATEPLESKAPQLAPAFAPTPEVALASTEPLASFPEVQAPALAVEAKAVTPTATEPAPAPKRVALRPAPKRVARLARASEEAVPLPPWLMAKGKARR